MVRGVFSRRIVGWAMSNYPYAELMLREVDMALLQRRADGAIDGNAGECYDARDARIVLRGTQSGTARSRTLRHLRIGPAPHPLVTGKQVQPAGPTARVTLEFEQFRAQEQTSSRCGLSIDRQRHRRPRRPPARAWTPSASLHVGEITLGL